MTGTDRLRRLLGGPDTAWLLQRVRRRLERGGTLTGTVTLTAATPSQRRAMELLLGRRTVPGASLSVPLAEVDRVLRASGACPGGLAAAVEALDGPVRDLAREQAETAAAWAAAFRPLDEAVASRPELAEWREWLDSSGLVRRLTSLEDAAGTLRRLAAVVRALPASGVPLGRFAAETCGNAHALDDGRPLATLANSSARAIAGLPFRADGGAESRRDTWAIVGVYLDELSSTVLCLGLPGDTATATGRMLAAMRGEPVSLTLRQLRRHTTAMRIDQPLEARGDVPAQETGLVRVCENPVVLTAAADALGPSCPPLVCCNGRPSAAVWRLLELLAEGASEFAYHCDFDWGGVAIATAVHTRIGWRPWRFEAADYLQAASDTPLTGRPTPTPWDPALATAMTERGVRVEEEQVLPHLIGDLTTPHNASRRATS
ncbi:TIGR02679 family protein [Actinomadura sp. NEAU-AAG7]|uniref:TIGR02679 family protein n=1 Tax=Actinomadura sp. NEAU-AAG7 TaxID=2839640 RepID=UPI001BE3F3A7|nr:TIGR02679 family protein [Actinomadura sp. NEAU-AAG7]MBT2207497.1 TIGR02679 family protein [Actinomadura sp. NEAU-AAG7]